MSNLGGVEFVLMLAIVVLFVGVAPYVTWRRGGSKLRIWLALLASLLPGLGFIVGMIIALTTRRPSPTPPSATTGQPITQSGGALTAPSGSARALAIIGAVVVVVSVASAAAGYYFARQDGRAIQPTWVDREIRLTGTQNVLRCTYHLSDGTVRVQETVIRPEPVYNPFRIGSPNPVSARTPDCPPSP